MVSHGHIAVNGKKVSIPSYGCRTGDVVEVRDTPKSRQLGTNALEKTQIRPVPDWLALNKEQFKGTLTRIPTREELNPVANEQLVVEVVFEVVKTSSSATDDENQRKLTSAVGPFPR